MSDFIWYIVTAVIFVALGMIFLRIGWQIWKNQKRRLDWFWEWRC